MSLITAELAEILTDGILHKKGINVSKCTYPLYCVAEYVKLKVRKSLLIEENIFFFSTES
jgi:hypothetical protein